MKGQKPPAATRGVSPGAGDDNEDNEEQGEEGGGEEPEIQDLVPRTDIGCVSHCVINNLASTSLAGWGFF